MEYSDVQMCPCENRHYITLTAAAQSLPRGLAQRSLDKDLLAWAEKKLEDHHIMNSAIVFMRIRVVIICKWKLIYLLFFWPILH